MSISTNISPFCLLNGTMRDQMFNYTQEELDDFHKALHSDSLSEVFDAVEQEYNNQLEPELSVDNLSDEDCKLLNQYIDKRLTASDKQSILPTVELLDGYIAISSSNLHTLDAFKDRVIDDSVQWEHRIKKHDGVIVHSYVFNTNEISD